jgi:hypothetical protein
MSISEMFRSPRNQSFFQDVLMIIGGIHFDTLFDENQRRLSIRRDSSPDHNRLWMRDFSDDSSAFCSFLNIPSDDAMILFIEFFLNNEELFIREDD